MRRLGLVCFIAMLLCQYVAHAQGRITKRKVKKLFKDSIAVDDHFTGFALYDLDKQQMIFELNSDKYFTPASNTKLFTFYACLQMLGDSIPTLRYVSRNDSLIFWGTGDPTFLHSQLKGTNAYRLLKQTDKKLFYAYGNYTGAQYGAGWAWDDYNDYYQAEINELPVFDNVAAFSADSSGKLTVTPSYMRRYLRDDASLAEKTFSIHRDFTSNEFVYPLGIIPTGFHQEVPWKVSPGLTAELLSDTLGKPVSLIKMAQPAGARVIYNLNADIVYRHMLQPSDNFVAEQLLLVCASTKFKELNTDSVINYATANFLNDLPDKPQWADGSGLSRLNLFTPRSIIALLVKIKAKVNNDELLHSLLPIGGVAGTIRSAYKTDNGVPFVWAKTGSLSNNHNQSGYLTTRSGRRLAFSFMNNNFTRSSREIRDDMVRIITYIHENF